MQPASRKGSIMANPRADRSAAPAASALPPKTAQPRRADAPARSDAKPAAVSRANEIVRAIGLRPITGLSGPKIGY